MVEAGGKPLTRPAWRERLIRCAAYNATILDHVAHACPHCLEQANRTPGVRRCHGHDGVRTFLLHTPPSRRDCRHHFWKFSPIKPMLLLASAVGALVGITPGLRLNNHGCPIFRTADSLPHARAAAGDAAAQSETEGLRYAEGDGVIQNDKEGHKWFALAAKQGQTEAQYHYGLALLKGHGVVQDYRAAFSWIEKAARAAIPRPNTAGELYRYGTGTSLDKPRAYLWFNLAGCTGGGAAAKARDSLVWQLKPEQLTAMQEEHGG